MSLIGIDVGSSSVKVGVYRRDGKALANGVRKLVSRRAKPGWWEIEPEELWMATLQGLRQVAAASQVKRDPPEVLAISASGREAFPVSRQGKAMGPCIMAGDLRGAEFEKSTGSKAETTRWYSACGHLPERMDPVNRLLWWRQYQSHVFNRARFFLGWHEFLTLRLGGIPVTDKSLAGKWLIYDLMTEAWSSQRLNEFAIDPAVLPEIGSWGSVIAEMKRSIASDLGFRSPLKIAVGAFDVSCAALGSGATGENTGGLVSGTWEDLTVPSSHPPAVEIVHHGMSLGPHPGGAGLAVFALSPNGTAVVDWARNMTGLSLRQARSALEKSDLQPSPVLAVPHFSGATVPWGHKRESRGILFGLTLATSASDVIKALMEAIAYDLCITHRLLIDAEMKITVLRAAGGGTRSDWWTQLKADLLGTPIEVTRQSEPGTLGAAMLAGLAVGTFRSLEEGTELWVSPTLRYEPDINRSRLHHENFEAYQQKVAALIRSP